MTVTLQKKSLISEAAFLNLKDCHFFFDPDLYLASTRPEKKFRHLTTTELLWRLDQIAQLMASFGQIEAVINYLKNIFGSDAQWVKISKKFRFHEINSRIAIFKFRENGNLNFFFVKTQFL